MAASDLGIVKNVMGIGLIVAGLLGFFAWWSGLYRPFPTSSILFLVPSILLARWYMQKTVDASKRSALYGKPDNTFHKVLVFGVSLFASYLFLNYFVGSFASTLIGEPHMRPAQIVTWMEESTGRRRNRGTCMRVRAIIEHPDKSMQMYQCLRGAKYRYQYSGGLPRILVRTIESPLGYYVEPEIYGRPAPRAPTFPKSQ